MLDRPSLPHRHQRLIVRQLAQRRHQLQRQVDRVREALHRRTLLPQTRQQRNPLRLLRSVLLQSGDKLRVFRRTARLNDRLQHRRRVDENRVRQRRLHQLREDGVLQRGELGTDALVENAREVPEVALHVRFD